MIPKLSVYPLYQLLNAWSNLFETWYMYIMAPEPTSPVYFLNPPHQSVCMNIPIILIDNMSVNVSLLMVGSGSVKTLPWQGIQMQI